MTTEGTSSVWQELAKAAQTREQLDLVLSKVRELEEIQKAGQTNPGSAKMSKAVVATAELVLRMSQQIALLHLRSEAEQYRSLVNLHLPTAGPKDAEHLRQFAMEVFTRQLMAEFEILQDIKHADDLSTGAEDAWKHVTDFITSIQNTAWKFASVGLVEANAGRAKAASTYRVLLEWDAEGPGWTVTVPVLPGCVTQGKTRDEALVRAKEAIAGHIAALSALGEEIPEDDGAEIVVERVEVATGAQEG